MIADSSEIKFECPQCGQSIVVDASGAGLSTKCPTCEYPLVIPTLSSLHDRDYGESAALSGRPAFGDEDTRLSAGEVEDLREELAEELRRADESAEALAETRKESAQHAQRAAVAETQLADARTMISDLGTQLAALEENRAQWERACTQTTEQASAAESQMAAREAELQAALAAAREESAALAAEHAAERTALLGQLENADACARLAAEAAAEKLTATQAEFDSAEAGRQALADRCQALRKEAETLRHDLSEIHTGLELLALRDRFNALETEHQRTAAALARGTAEVQTLTTATATLHADLAEARTRAAEAERRAEAASETALKKDNEVLRGIIERQNTVGEERFTELRRLRRARLALRILYAFIALALVGVIALAIDYLPAAVQQFLHEWFGIRIGG